MGRVKGKLSAASLHFTVWTVFAGLTIAGFFEGSSWVYFLLFSKWLKGKRQILNMFLTNGK